MNRKEGDKRGEKVGQRRGESKKGRVRREEHKEKGVERTGKGKVIK